jgi:hypothetical protein
MRSLLPALTILLIAGCTKQTEQADSADIAAAETPIAEGNGPPPPPDAGAGPIPVALHGRWGLVPADCTSDRGDAKGLVEISAEGLRFYESRAKVGTLVSSDAKGIHAQFDFSGEGQTWSRDMTLALGEGGTTLIRSETGEDALVEPLAYTKCS